MKLIDTEVVQRVVKTIDATALGSIGLVTSVLFSGPDQQTGSVTPVFLAILVALSAMIGFRASELYQPVRWLAAWHTVMWSLIIAAIAGLFVATISRLTPCPLSLDWFWSWIGCSSLYLVVSRIALCAWSKTMFGRGRFQKRVAIVGGGAAAETALSLLDHSNDPNLEIVGLFDDRHDTRSPMSVLKYKKVGTIGDLPAYARQNQIDLIIVAIPASAEQRLLHILRRLWELPVDIRISAAASKLKLSPAAYSYLGDLPLLNVFERPLRGWSAFLKDMLDRSLAFCSIIVLSPVLLAVALAVRLESRGPIIFRQKRFGFNNEMIEVFKFRSMYVDKGDATASKLVTRNDPRVTRVGRFIRKSSLDELPQLVNVLRGDLSLVGPRPHATHAKAAGTLYDEVVDGYFARHKVKPGITGWAQINGWRGETDTREKLEQRVKHDLEYIDKWSLGFDLYILAKTPLALVKSENAF